MKELLSLLNTIPEYGLLLKEIQQNRSAAFSQGAPVAIPNTPEGDVNATNVTMSMVGNIYISLGLEDYAVPLFAPELRDRYIKLLEEKRDRALSEG